MATPLTAGSDMSAAPAVPGKTVYSRMVNPFSGRLSWLFNLPLRVIGLITLATPIHELGHNRNAGLKDLITGKTEIKPTPSAYLGGIAANFALGTVFAMITAASLLLGGHDIVLIASVVSIANLLSGMAELLPGGDIDNMYRVLQNNYLFSQFIPESEWDEDIKEHYRGPDIYNAQLREIGTTDTSFERKAQAVSALAKIAQEDRQHHQSHFALSAIGRIANFSDDDRITKACFILADTFLREKYVSPLDLEAIALIIRSAAAKRPSLPNVDTIRAIHRVIGKIYDTHKYSASNYLKALGEIGAARKDLSKLCMDILIKVSRQAVMASNDIDSLCYSMENIAQSNPKAISRRLVSTLSAILKEHDKLGPLDMTKIAGTLAVITAVAVRDDLREEDVFSAFKRLLFSRMVKGIVAVLLVISILMPVGGTVYQSKITNGIFNSKASMVMSASLKSYEINIDEYGSREAALAAVNSMMRDETLPLAQREAAVRALAKLARSDTTDARWAFSVFIEPLQFSGVKASRDTYLLAARGVAEAYKEAPEMVDHNQVTYLQTLIAAHENDPEIYEAALNSLIDIAGTAGPLSEHAWSMIMLHAAFHIPNETVARDRFVKIITAGVSQKRLEPAKAVQLMENIIEEEGHIPWTYHAAVDALREFNSAGFMEIVPGSLAETVLSFPSDSPLSYHTWTHHKIYNNDYLRKLAEDRKMPSQTRYSLAMAVYHNLENMGIAISDENEREIANMIDRVVAARDRVAGEPVFSPEVTVINMAHETEKGSRFDIERMEAVERKAGVT
ncbi:MAG TPA: hypothetical protein PLV52_04435, partial [Candidatus Omnitrophota bacterium]|nr:hypothetical protein [Candidatus Omnitrophota bacterium]